MFVGKFFGSTHAAEAVHAPESAAAAEGSRASSSRRVSSETTRPVAAKTPPAAHAVRISLDARDLPGLIGEGHRSLARRPHAGRPFGPLPEETAAKAPGESVRSLATAVAKSRTRAAIPAEKPVLLAPNRAARRSVAGEKTASLKAKAMARMVEERAHPPRQSVAPREFAADVARPVMPRFSDAQIGGIEQALAMKQFESAEATLTSRAMAQRERAALASLRPMSDADADIVLDALTDRQDQAVRDGNVKETRRLANEKIAVVDRQIAEDERHQQEAREAALVAEQHRIDAQRAKEDHLRKADVKKSIAQELAYLEHDAQLRATQGAKRRVQQTMQITHHAAANERVEKKQAADAASNHARQAAFAQKTAGVKAADRVQYAQALRGQGAPPPTHDPKLFAAAAS